MRLLGLLLGMAVGFSLAHRLIIAQMMLAAFRGYREPEEE